MGRSSSRRSSSPAPAKRAAPAHAPAPVAAARPAAAPAPAPAPSHAPVPHASSAPAVHHPAPAPVSQGPGLLTQIAANAASVAVGSVVAHTVMGAINGSGDKQAAAPAPAAPAPAYSAPAYGPPAQSNPCSYELEQFLSCAQRFPSDLGSCSGFNDQLKQCKLNFGMQ